MRAHRADQGHNQADKDAKRGARMWDEVSVKLRSTPCKSESDRCRMDSLLFAYCPGNCPCHLIFFRFMFWYCVYWELAMVRSRLKSLPMGFRCRQRCLTAQTWCPPSLSICKGRVDGWGQGAMALGLQEFKRTEKGGGTWARLRDWGTKRLSPRPLPTFTRPWSIFLFF